MTNETIAELLHRQAYIQTEVARLKKLKRTDHRSRHIGSLNFTLAGIESELEDRQSN